MLIAKEESRDFLERCNQFQAEVDRAFASDQGSCDVIYINELISQTKSVLLERTELSVSVAEKDFFDSYRDKILLGLNANVSVKSLEKIHYSFAQMLRSLTVLGNGDFNAHPVVAFYLTPSFQDILRDKIDRMTFQIPAEYQYRQVLNAVGKVNEQYNKVVSWEESIREIESRVRDSENRYKDVLKGNNYMGLAHAFTKMIERKEWEAMKLLIGVLLLGGAALAIPAVQIYLEREIRILSEVSVSSISAVVFTVAAEMILLYYFRIIYQRFSNVKTQISQLELRHAMCAFVQDYAEKSKDLDRNSMAKFENMIFSEVSADSAAPPSVYDAIDSVAKVLAAWKPK